MKKIIAAILLGSLVTSTFGAAINATNVVTITANTNVQAVLKDWLDANVAGAGANYLQRFNICAGEQLTNWIRRIYKEQLRINADAAADASVKTNQLISPVVP